ncbi:YceI family protein [Defluviimonas sp. WL0002]|uniref:YceI family protein n=1 Tax=Albidovulum marisflavi TaxID=2984159 RepID=A0ABT2ZBN4_9RHOB|nr:YceI family protein [Defluviimonas sp. WL0002]MCV2868465.1 YceI family protein [Defluviimonas sp. WL0002]
MKGSPDSTRDTAKGAFGGSRHRLRMAWLPGLLWGLIALVAHPALSAPLDYLLDVRGSQVGFEVEFNQGIIRGTMPIASTAVVLDFDNAANSRADVILNADGARANVPFATQAMKSEGVLDTARFPTITFTGTKFRRDGDAASVQGTITLRGQTRPITLDAQIFRPQGTQPGYRERLSVQLTGTLLRSEFGATGFADMVGDKVRLRILARLVLSP